MQEMFDTLPCEVNRGITVKSTSFTVLHTYDSQVYAINIVDSPGHEDFNDQVGVSLCNTDGALLLVDATKGPQAMTCANYSAALERGNVVLPALTKCDNKNTKLSTTAVSMMLSDACQGIDPDDVIETSARENYGITECLNAIIERVPAPSPSKTSEKLSNLKAGSFAFRIIDSWYDVDISSVVCVITVLKGDAEAKRKVRIHQGESGFGVSAGAGKHSDKVKYIKEVGVLLPNRSPTTHLPPHAVGYAIMNVKDPRDARPGGIVVTDCVADDDARGALGYYFAQDKLHGSQTWSNSSAIYATVHLSSMENDSGVGFEHLVSAIKKLAINDAGLDVSFDDRDDFDDLNGGSEGNKKGYKSSKKKKRKKSSASGASSSSSSSSSTQYLGPGIKVGFRGLLHIDIFLSRLSSEYGVSAICTSPKVTYKVVSKCGNDERLVRGLEDWPDCGSYTIYEPVVDCTVFTPVKYAGKVMEMISERRGRDVTTETVDEGNWKVRSVVPWGEIVQDFHDDLKVCLLLLLLLLLSCLLLCLYAPRVLFICYFSPRL